MRLVLMGTSHFAVPLFTELIAQGHDIAAIYTQPPRPAGRGMVMRRTPVHELALGFNLEVLTPVTLSEPATHALFASHKADIALVAAYGLILPKAILNLPLFGCLNLHASLLPRWRGAAPIQRAIMAGDKETGVTVMQMETGLDTGPICMAERLAIRPDMTAGELHDNLALLGADLMCRAIAALSRGGLEWRPQEAVLACYAPKIEKSETRISWTAPVLMVHNQIRSLSPHPGAWCEMPLLRGWERVRILQSSPVEGAGAPGTLLGEGLTIACGEGALQIHRVQRSGKVAVSAAEFLRGALLRRDEKVR